MRLTFSVTLSPTFFLDRMGETASRAGGEEKQIETIYQKYKEFMAENPTWSLFLITTDKTVEERIMGRPADRRRKLYNGRLEVCYYQFHGKKE